MPKGQWIRIRATEREALINTAAQRFMESPREGIETAIAYARQTVLNKERQEGITTKELLSRPWCVPSVQALVAKLRQEQPKPKEEQSQSASDGRDRDSDKGLNGSGGFADLSSIPTEQLIKEISNRMVTEAIAQLKATLQQTVQQSVASVPAVAEREHKAKVAIVGLLKNQQRMIEREFPEFDLRFFKPNGNGSQYTGKLCKNADFVLGMTGFMSHSTDDHIKNTIVRERYIRVPGGMTQLRDELTKLYVGITQKD